MMNEQLLFIQPVVKLGCTTSLTTGCIQDRAACQLVVKNVKRVWQLVGCMYTRYNRFSNWFDNRSYRV